MNIASKKSLFLIPLSIMLVGCQATGNQYAGNVYDTTQVNQKQEARTVKIISVMPAQIAVDNTQAKEATKTFGALLGAVAGGAIGYNSGSGKSTAGTAAGAIGGGVLGAATGHLVDDKVLVEGVTLSYSEDDKIFSSTQVGKQCEYQPGIALIVSTQYNETRIQPNTACPKA
ncbi:hypothetical protein ABR850_03015 [Aeromonas veronii]|uniref:hypothetical protein n=1 Tax=Aeromonas TaxID=642 RepID=UPI001F221AD7|nr:hypothetical protein [Aeromonas australiensis]EKP0294985.1 hypothetical protein [Aeromonas veronii]MCF3098969.1 hypothetical protein [Aeromonas australiensis]